MQRYLEAEALDIAHGIEFMPMGAITGSNDIGVVEGSDIVVVTDPNNPTGRTLTEPEMDAIVAYAERVGAWILSDEVYRGANRRAVHRHGEADTPSFYGRYDKVLAIGSMSKAYGLPGLRIGWIVGPSDTLDEIWARHEYVTISATMLSNKLAALALLAAHGAAVLLLSAPWTRPITGTALCRWAWAAPGVWCCSFP